MQTGHCDPRVGPLSRGGQEGCLEEACLLGQLTMEARMGRKSVVVATLLVHSVKMATRRQRIKTMAGGGTLCSGVSLSPSHADRPDSCGQKRLVCERRGCLGSRSPLLRLWEGHLSVHTSLGSSKSRAAWEGRTSQNQGAPSPALEEQLGVGRRVR